MEWFDHQFIICIRHAATKTRVWSLSRCALTKPWIIIDCKRSTNQMELIFPVWIRKTRWSTGNRVNSRRNYLLVKEKYVDTHRKTTNFQISKEKVRSRHWYSSCKTEIILSAVHGRQKLIYRRFCLLPSRRVKWLNAREWDVWC